MDQLPKGGVRGGGLLAGRTFVEHLQGPVEPASAAFQEGQQVNGGGGLPRSTLLLGLEAGGREKGFGLGVVSMTAGDQQLGQPEPAVDRLGRLAHQDGLEQRAASLVKPPETLGLEGLVDQVRHSGRAHRVPPGQSAMEVVTCTTSLMDRTRNGRDDLANDPIPHVPGLDQLIPGADRLSSYHGPLGRRNRDDANRPNARPVRRNPQAIDGSYSAEPNAERRALPPDARLRDLLLQSLVCRQPSIDGLTSGSHIRERER